MPAADMTRTCAGRARALVLLALLAAMPLLAPPARADTPLVATSGGDSLSLWVDVHWPNPLPGFVEERLRRGIPATVGYRAELWKERSGWFDSHLSTAGREMKVVRDPWSDSFLMQLGDSSAVLGSMDDLLSTLANARIRIPLEREWCDRRSRYRVVVTVFVRPLTARDVGEVEGWLRGEIKGSGGGILGLPRGLFAIVRDLTGLGERTEQGSSSDFRIAEAPIGRVWILAAGGDAAPEDRIGTYGRTRSGIVTGAPPGGSDDKPGPAPAIRTQ
jgi:hypothetical protein